MSVSQKVTKLNSKPTIIRQGHLAEKIVIVDGFPGCGKTLFSPIVAAMDRVELLNYTFEIEFVCRLFHLQKLEEDAAIALVRMFTDHKRYQTMMGRETNFRYSDISSVFNDSNPWRYFKRIFQEGDMIIPERIKKERPILHLTTHDLLSMSKPVFDALDDRLIFIEIVRHPLYMVIQQTLNMERIFFGNPRDIQIYIKHGDKQLPYFAYQWKDLFVESNNVEKTIYSMNYCSKLTESFKNNYNKVINGKILTIPFERFVLDPWPYTEQIKEMLGSEVTRKTIKSINKQNVPRKKISDGIPLAIYKRCGWDPPVEGLTERGELDKRRQFAIDQGANKDAIKVLDQMSAKYEETYGLWF